MLNTLTGLILSIQTIIYTTFIYKDMLSLVLRLHTRLAGQAGGIALEAGIGWKSRPIAPRRLAQSKQSSGV